jgi:hypothetical protein
MMQMHDSSNFKPRVLQSTNFFTCRCRCSGNQNQRLYKVQTSSHAQMYKVVIKTKSGTKYKLSKASKKLNNSKLKKKKPSYDFDKNSYSKEHLKI